MNEDVKAIYKIICMSPDNWKNTWGRIAVEMHMAKLLEDNKVFYGSPDDPLPGYMF